jgi:magnesium transporter
MTMVAGSGGNAGVQTLALVVRGLALGELTFLNARRVVMKEFLTGALNGLALGCVAAVLAYAWKGVPLLGFVVAMAIVGNLCIAALVGVLIPLGLKWWASTRPSRRPSSSRPSPIAAASSSSTDSSRC